MNYLGPNSFQTDSVNTQFVWYNSIGILLDKFAILLISCTEHEASQTLDRAKLHVLRFFQSPGTERNARSTNYCKILILLIFTVNLFKMCTKWLCVRLLHLLIRDIQKECLTCTLTLHFQLTRRLTEMRSLKHTLQFQACPSLSARSLVTYI